MAKQNLRAVPVESDIEDALNDGFSRIGELRDECQEIVDNATDGLCETQRIQTLEETANALDGSDSIPACPECLSGLRVSYTEDQRKSKSTSRATRCNEACSLLYAVVEAAEAWLEENEEHDGCDEVQSFIEEVQEMIDNAEGCEFPGMFG